MIVDDSKIQDGGIPISERKHTGEDNLPDCFIHPKDSIPHGPYCYFGSRNPSADNYKPCGYWEFIPAKDEESSPRGHCNYLNKTDEDGSCDLLWDQVKECGINDDYEDL